MLITSHQLASFGASSVFLTIGETRLLPLVVRNIQNEPDDIYINLTGYPFAEFEHDCSPGECVISSNKRNIRVIGVNPYEERQIFIRLLSTGRGDYTLSMNATSGLKPTIEDSHDLSIKIGYPVYFPGLGDYAIILIIIISSLYIFLRPTGLNRKRR